MFSLFAKNLIASGKFTFCNSTMNFTASPPLLHLKHFHICLVGAAVKDDEWQNGQTPFNWAPFDVKSTYSEINSAMSVFLMMFSTSCLGIMKFIFW